MSADRFRSALAWGLGQAAVGLSLSALLHIRPIWPGPVMVFGIILITAHAFPERRRP